MNKPGHNGLGHRAARALLHLALLPTTLLGGDALFIVGGGPLPEESQVSIERNVIWIDALTETPAFDTRRLLFTAGAKKVKDIVEQRRDDSDLRTFLPLSRIFGEQHDALSIFRPNRLRKIDAPATAASVDRQLSATLAGLRRGDSLWFIYNGHGGMESSDPSENTLRLWNDSTLDVRRFATILRARPTGVTVRSFMPQCFSGGFARSIAMNPAQPSPEGIDTLQCGFYSVPHNQESEGCTISVDSGEYRDYSSYFFAALSGRTREGNAVELDAPDSRPTLLDAHRWAYVNAASTDIPFSSSEYFLELWQPWYLRWQTVRAVDGDNPYFRTALALAKKLGIESTGLHELATVSDEGRATLQTEIDEIRRRLDGAVADEKGLRETLLNDFLQQYPEALFPYNGKWVEAIKARGGQIAETIRNHPDYPRLARLQEKIDRLDQQLLDAERASTPYLRIERMLKLATIFEQFKRHADAAARDRYEALIACESWTPPLAVTTARSKSSSGQDEALSPEAIAEALSPRGRGFGRGGKPLLFTLSPALSLEGEGAEIASTERSAP